MSFVEFLKNIGLAIFLIILMIASAIGAIMSLVFAIPAQQPKQGILVGVSIACAIIFLLTVAYFKYLQPAPDRVVEVRHRHKRDTNTRRAHVYHHKSRRRRR